MTADLDHIRIPIEHTLRPLGFRSKGKRLWDREAGKVVQVFHLDKSSYGSENRIDILLGLSDLVSRSKYKLSDFDVVLRFSRLSETAGLLPALDQDRLEMLPGVRRSIIHSTLNDFLRPILELAVDEIGIRQIQERFPSKNDFFVGPRTLARLPAA